MEKRLRPEDFLTSATSLSLKSLKPSLKILIHNIKPSSDLASSLPISLSNSISAAILSFHNPNFNPNPPPRSPRSPPTKRCRRSNRSSKTRPENPTRIRKKTSTSSSPSFKSSPASRSYVPLIQKTRSGCLTAPSTPKPSSPESTSDSPATAVTDLVNSLTTHRVYREVTLALRSGLRDLRAEFFFLRVRGLRSLLKFLRSVAESDSTINLFSQTQSIPDLQVVPVLFQHSLKEAEDDIVRSLDPIFGVEPMKITTPSTDSEISLALRVLEGCCLLHRDSAVLAHQHKAIQMLMNILPTRGVAEQGVCLDALTAILLDSSDNQMDPPLLHT